MSKRNPRLLLEDILDSCGKILTYTEGLTFDEFVVDDRTIDAVIRNLEIIGAAANRLPLDFCKSNGHIAWHQMIGMRNRLIHAYFGVDYEIVWDIIIRTLPHFSKEVRLILSERNE